MSELLGSTVGPKIKLAIDVPPGVPAARADQNQLEMAILNLAVNARDAMEHGGTLTLRLQPRAVADREVAELPAGHYLQLTVADTGCGMDSETLARATEPFFSTKGLGKGTGLGLSMVHGLASQLGGALTIDSQPDDGTSVKLWLPASEAEAVVSDTATSAQGSFVGGGTALVVDDEALVRASTADMMTELGYRVVEADSGEAALRAIEQGGRFDIIVTDHLMPGQSGTELAHAVRALGRAIPVLIVSGYADSAAIDPDLPRLAKPFRRDELASCLRELTSVA
jgi:CheY-like chemotaxis protein/anti-sigma regulatory factor (Ser/Thr protein kinase)